MTRFLQRILKAALLNRATYEQIETDRSATGQAFLVVLLASAAAGLGAIENHGPMGILISILLLGPWPL